MSKVAGVILSVIGGSLSLLLGLFIFDIYPEFLIFGELFVLTFQIILILGGVISLFGALLSYIRPKLAWIIILIGALLGGGNILTIFGAIQIKKFKDTEIPKFVVKNDYTNLEWLEEQYYTLKKSIQEIANDQNVSIMEIKKWVDKIERTKISQTE